MPSLPLYDPLAEQPATREAINEERDRREVAPVEVLGRSYDCDPRSDSRFREAIALWDYLGQETIEWTCADNSTVTLDKAGLQAVYAEVQLARGARALLLHEIATSLKAALPGVTMRDVQSAFA